MSEKKYKLMPLPYVFTIGDVQLVHVIMGQAQEMRMCLDCLESVRSELPDDSYFAPPLSEELCIVDTFCQSTFGADDVVCKNLMTVETCREMFEFYQQDGLGLLAVAAYVSSEESWQDFFKLVKRMARVLDGEGGRRMRSMVIVGELTTEDWKRMRDAGRAEEETGAEDDMFLTPREFVDDELPCAEQFAVGDNEEELRSLLLDQGEMCAAPGGEEQFCLAGTGEKEEDFSEGELYKEEIEEFEDDEEEEDVGEPLTKEEIINLRLDEISNYLCFIERQAL